MRRDPAKKRPREESGGEKENEVCSPCLSWATMVT